MSEAIAALVSAILMLAAQEIRRRIKKTKTSTTPPPPTVEDCKRCFFFREFQRQSKEHRGDSDTKIIRLYRKEP
jgi:hypothetical protein